MTGDGSQNLNNRVNIAKKNAEYIEKKINSLSIYNTYWCLFEFRSNSKSPPVYILKDDSLIKKQIISILKSFNYTPKLLDDFLQTSARNSIPLSYVRWFYEDARAALWLNMVLKKLSIMSNHISIESDIEIFVHDLIFNEKLMFALGSFRRAPDNYSEPLIARKKESLDILKNIYINSSVGYKETKWIDRRNEIQINHLYQYMQKLHDLDNLKSNKDNKKNNSKSKSDVDKSGYKPALICIDTIRFKETDTASRLHHMLASLDYWVFNPDSHIAGELKAANRATFIDNMKDVCSSKANRVRNKKIKEEGLGITRENLKILKLIAKRQGKTQGQMLNDIIESYDQTFFSQVPKSTRETITDYSMIKYVKLYTDPFDTEQSLRAEQFNPEPVLAGIDNTEARESDYKNKMSELTPNIEDSVCTSNAEPVVNAQQNQSDDKTVSLDNGDDIATENSIDDDINRHEVMIAIKNTSTLEANDPLTKPQATEINLASDENLHNIDDKIADDDPFLINAKLIRQKTGRT